MNLTIYQVDAFARKVFEGNPAAVVPLANWLKDDILQAIALENNLSETAYFVKAAQGYELRWFTPAEEVDLCGHATLATAHVLFEHLGYHQKSIRFFTRSGELVVEQRESGLVMNFPATMPQRCETPDALIAGLNGTKPTAVLADFDFVIELANEQQVKALAPDFGLWKTLDRRGIVVTAKGDDVDFVSRCFYPILNVEEDPATGSAHCLLAPYWAKKLKKTQLKAKQLSVRGADIACEVVGDRVMLIGQCKDYMKGEIIAPIDES